MLKINRILCPIDFSEFSVKAYDYAQSLAWHYKASLLLEHVTEIADADVPVLCISKCVH